MTKQRAVIEMVFAGALWGLSFVAAIWALESFTPVETLVFRFVLATLGSEILYFLFKGFRYRNIQKELRLALPAGLLLGTLLLLQTIGLTYTTATKSGFITSLYVILVPLFNAWFFRSPGLLRNYLFATLALVGTFLLVGTSFADFNTGDLWTLACAAVAAFHIIYIGKVSGRLESAFRFNSFQSFWCLLALLPLLMTQEKIHIMEASLKPWLGILCLGLGSSLIAFFLQVRTQRVLSDSTASMLFLLESPFAAIFGFLLLQERLNLLQTTGAVIILVASSLQILLEPSTKTTEKTL